MDFCNAEFLKPLLYRDMLAPENSPMGAAIGCRYGYGMGRMYPTNLLGGITMPNSLQEDAFVNLQQRKNKDFNFLKKALIVLGVIAALDLMKFRGIKNTKWGKKILGWFGYTKPAGQVQKKGNWFTNLFKRKN